MRRSVAPASCRHLAQHPGGRLEAGATKDGPDVSNKNVGMPTSQVLLEGWFWYLNGEFIARSFARYEVAG